jgi:hypothetical protein
MRDVIEAHIYTRLVTVLKNRDPIVGYFYFGILVEKMKYCKSDFHSCTVHIDIIRVFHLPADAQENCFKKNITVYIKTAPTCFGSITIIRERII